jgi:hypothetical protein
MNRYTFVIQVHPSGPSTLENLSTQERVRIADLGAVGPQIERWLRELPSPPIRSASAVDGESASPGAPPG